MRDGCQEVGAGSTGAVNLLTYPYVWRWRQLLGDRHGQPCRVVVRGRLNSALVEFTDGYQVVTSRWAVRKARKP